jgi:hypothetical protein
MTKNNFLKKKDPPSRNGTDLPNDLEELPLRLHDGVLGLVVDSLRVLLGRFIDALGSI